MTQATRMRPTGPVENLIRNDRRIVAGAVVLVVILAAIYTYGGAGMPMIMASGPAWGPQFAMLMFLMWWIMMIAMMTPSAAPMLLLYTALKRVGPQKSHAALYSGILLGGYLVVWGGFSILATVLQWQLQTSGLISGADMAIRSHFFAGAVLLSAGLYQFSGLKNACLTHCRAPGQFLSRHSRPGASGAFYLGVWHGFYCLGCCWALMALLFVGGIMNLYWIAGLALYVLIEKAVRNGQLLVKITGGV
jgi:predicted metal-binding membrane protein